jgi:UDP-2-acetamido-3-amino-2,3-dideoxy-glucuronate N-acetyltransferase
MGELEGLHMDSELPFIHSTADVSPRATIGTGTCVWHQAQVREGARIGNNCIIGKGVYIDFDVTIGSNVKIQNGTSVYHGVVVEDGVFLGPGVILTNDRLPRAINPDGTLKTDTDWKVSPIKIQRGASLGAGAVVLPGVIVGEFAMVGAGAVVTQDVATHALVYGNPARWQGYVCRCGRPLIESGQDAWRCDICDESYRF